MKTLGIELNSKCPRELSTSAKAHRKGSPPGRLDAGTAPPEQDGASRQGAGSTAFWSPLVASPPRGLSPLSWTQTFPGVSLAPRPRLPPLEWGEGRGINGPRFKWRGPGGAPPRWMLARGCAWLAQSVERWTLNPSVVGSSPTSGVLWFLIWWPRKEFL